MVKLAKAAKCQTKLKKTAPPPKEVEDSDEEDSEEDDSSDEEEEEEIVLPKKKTVTPAKKIATPAKTIPTPAKKATTPSKKAVTPAKAAAVSGKKGIATAKNGKKVQKEDSDEEDEDEDDDDDSEEESEEEKPTAKQESEDEDEEDDEDDSEEEAMDTTPPAVKGKKTPVKPKEESEDEEEEEDSEEEEDEEEEDEEAKEGSKVSGKRKKEMPKKKSTPEAKKPKTEEAFSVFIGNLNSSKDFDEIKEAVRRFFSKKNLSVVDVRVGASKKFGYADFSSEEDLESALELSGKKVMGQEVKLERAKSKEGIKEHKKERDARTLFVKNLPYSTTADELKEVFENAVDVRLPLGKDGSGKGIAYVEFQTEADAEAALEAKQGTEVEGRAIVVDYTGEKSQQSGGGKKGESKTLIVNNLSYSATEDSLQELFQKAVSVRVPQNNQGRPKGFAFVEFSSLEDAKEALESYNNTEIEGRTIRLEFSQPAGSQGGGNSRGSGGGQTKTLFVRGLSDETTEETLREAFEGSVGARIATDRDTGASKGFGFVDFSTAEEAKAAKEAMEDGEIDGNKVILDFAKPKGDSHRGGRGGFGGKGGGRGGFGRGGGRGRGGFGRGGGGGFRGGNKPQGKKIKFD